ncbi:MAG TPA: peptidoglycan DD-metalloendopeptidase family protein [Actinomycetota bacterium]|nr:peptidoglycan DD-metalloendopeptidase family protein [Actinomycetota bacterium]
MPTERSFPIAFRLAAAVVAVVLLAFFVPVAARVANAVTEDDVQQARDDRKAARAEKRQLFADLAAMQSELAAVQARLAEASAQVEAADELLAETEAELLATEQRLERTARRYDRIVAQLNDRITEAFIEGPGSSFGFLLGATSITDLSDRIEFVDAVARSDAGLAQEAENLRNVLEADAARLEDLRRERERRAAEAERHRKQIAADLERQEQLTAQIDAAHDEAIADAEAADKDLRQLERELAQQQSAFGGHSGVPMPAGWEDVLEVCPVGSPRGFGDGFGAPRYVGGYHPHRGVDIVAPEGTPVYAPFDGVASDASNLYGGTSVYVSGKYGRVYNAHLSSIAKLGPVSAGDVIGYVSSTGLAGGSTPHDHFEFFPNVMPSGWPTSYYGYSQIDGRLNPYPMLVAACG